MRESAKSSKIEGRKDSILTTKNDETPKNKSKFVTP